MNEKSVNRRTSRPGLYPTTRKDSSDHFNRLLLNQFVHPGIDDNGEHLRLQVVTEPFSSNVQNSQGLERRIHSCSNNEADFAAPIARLYKSEIAVRLVFMDYANDYLLCEFTRAPALDPCSTPSRWVPNFLCTTQGRDPHTVF